MVDPIVGILVTIILILAGWGYADHQRRLGQMENRMDEHDKWAAMKAEQLAKVEESANNVIWRLDRLDGRLDVLDQKISRLIERSSGNHTG